MNRSRMVYGFMFMICLAGTSFGGEPMQWFNFQTQQYDTLNDAPQTDADAMKYISQIAPAQGLYHTYRAMGCTIIEAMGKVLKATAGLEDTIVCQNDRS
jgi:hypothetical protein